MLTTILKLLGIAHLLSSLPRSVQRFLGRVFGVLLAIIAFRIALAVVVDDWKVWAIGSFIAALWIQHFVQEFSKRSKTAKRLASTMVYTPTEFPQGCFYTWRDSYGTIRYEGKSGDVFDALNRMRSHLQDPRSALYGKIRKDWTCLITMTDTEEEALDIESQRIDASWNTPGLENRIRGRQK